MELRIELENSKGIKTFAEYSSFQIQNEHLNFKLSVSGYRGSIHDSLLIHNEQFFSTFDQIHSIPTNSDCLSLVGGGWWFKE